MGCSMLGLPVHCQLPEFTQIHVYRVSDAIQPSHPLSSPSPPAFSLSQHQGLFQWVGPSHQGAKNWSFSISSSNDFSGLIFFRIDWFYFLAVQGTLKSLLQHHNSKASILQRSALFVVQHPYMTTGKTKTLTAQTFVGSYEINQMWVSVCQCQAHKEPSASSSGYFWNRESANN